MPMLLRVATFQDDDHTGYDGGTFDVRRGRD
jgi:hypothetical protein